MHEQRGMARMNLEDLQEQPALRSFGAEQLSYMSKFNEAMALNSTCRELEGGNYMPRTFRSTEMSWNLRRWNEHILADCEPLSDEWMRNWSGLL